MIVGGGIGGLAAAISLRRAGVDAVVFERAEELREIGAGITLWANAIKALGRLGMAEAVREAGTPWMGGALRSPDGGIIYEIPAAAMEERFESDGVVLHRAELQRTLLGALDGDAVRLGAGFTGFEQGQTGVVARFADGREERCDLLVGADGLHSTVRAQLLDDGPPRYAGYTAWRGVVAWLGGETGFESWGRGERFGLVDIGRGRSYWYAGKNAPEREKGSVGRKEELLERFGSWHEPIPEIIGAMEETGILRHDVYDRGPTKRWGEGRITLLGDAAHPMTPDLGQGACQAIEDAVVLARCVREEGDDDVVAALRLYEGRRKRRTTAIGRRSRLLGRVAQFENPLLCRLRDSLVKATPLRAQLRQLAPIIGYEA